MNEKQINNISKTFEQVHLHKYIGNIIVKHSTNPNHISEYVYKNLKFHDKLKIADIGCGFGRCVNYLKNIVPHGSEYIGIDPILSNKTTLKKNTSQAGFKSNFLCGDADRISEFPENYFDLILCNYSLYFFVDKLPLIINYLNPKGLFITITHSNKSLNELLVTLKKVLKIDYDPIWSDLGSEQILDNFNAENGLELLNPHFGKIEKIKYINNLEFDKNSIKELFDFLNFKKPTLIYHNNYVDYIKTKEFDDLLMKEVIKKIEKSGRYILNKDDVVFRCRNPIRY